MSFNLNFLMININEKKTQYFSTIKDKNEDKLIQPEKYIYDRIIK